MDGRTDGPVSALGSPSPQPCSTPLVQFSHDSSSPAGALGSLRPPSQLRLLTNLRLLALQYIHSSLLTPPRPLLASSTTTPVLSPLVSRSASARHSFCLLNFSSFLRHSQLCVPAAGVPRSRFSRIAYRSGTFPTSRAHILPPPSHSQSAHRHQPHSLFMEPANHSEPRPPR